MKSARRLIECGLVAALAAAVVGAQENQQPLATFFAPLEVPLVSVDVFVSDRSGQPVSGLTREDFEIYEDGQRVPVSHFYAAPGVSESAESVAESVEEPAESEPSQDLYLVILFDDTNLSRGRRQSAIEYLRKFLGSELPSGVQVMLVRYDGHLNIEREFTDDPAEAVRALDSLQGSASLSPWREEDRLLRDMENAVAIAATSGRSSDTVLESAGSSILQQIDSFSEQMAHRTRTSIANQERLIRSLSGLEGRKAMLLVSDGVAARPGELLYRSWAATFGSVPAFRLDAQRAFLMANRTDIGKEFNDLARFANGHRVSYYSLSALGLGQARATSAESRSMDEQGLAIDQSMSAEVAMSNLAGTTGGRTLPNSPALAEELDEVSVELSSYYSLAFEPAHSGDGKYHRLEVRINKAGVRARYREGYLDVSPAERMEDRLLAAAVHGVQENTLGISVVTGEPTARDDGTYFLPVLIRVPIAQLFLVPSQEEHQGRISIILTVRDDRGDLAPIHTQEYPVVVRNADLSTALGQSAGFTLRLVVRPGKQLIAVGVMDEIAFAESVTTLEVVVGDSDGTSGP
jgi:VWFA-related protein